MHSRREPRNSCAQATAGEHRHAAAVTLTALLVAGAGLVPFAAPAGAQDSTARSPVPSTPRSRRFTTSEGTWMSVDVSPDGRTVVFDLLGDLYALPIAVGATTRITSGPTWDSHPRFSSDGKRIVFVSDRTGAENVWTADAEPAAFPTNRRGSDDPR